MPLVCSTARTRLDGAAAAGIVLVIVGVARKRLENRGSEATAVVRVKARSNEAMIEAVGPSASFRTLGVSLRSKGKVLVIDVGMRLRFGRRREKLRDAGPGIGSWSRGSREAPLGTSLTSFGLHSSMAFKYTTRLRNQKSRNV